MDQSLLYLGHLQRMSRERIFRSSVRSQVNDGNLVKVAFQGFEEFRRGPKSSTSMGLDIREHKNCGGVIRGQEVFGF